METRDAVGALRRWKRRNYKVKCISTTRRVGSRRVAGRSATANFILASPLDSLNAECKGRHYVSFVGRNVLSQSETRSVRERKNRTDPRAGAGNKGSERARQQPPLLPFRAAKRSRFHIVFRVLTGDIFRLGLRYDVCRWRMSDFHAGSKNESL